MQGNTKTICGRDVGDTDIRLHSKYTKGQEMVTSGLQGRNN